MNNVEYAKWSKVARKYGFKVSQDDSVVELNKQLFRDLVKRHASCRVSIILASPY